MEKPIFNYTLHRHFWKSIASFKTVTLNDAFLNKNLTIYQMLVNKCLYEEDNSLSIDEIKEIYFANNQCLACEYKENMLDYTNDKDFNCHYCPLYVPENVMSSLPKEYRCSSNVFEEQVEENGCLGGLYTYYNDLCMEFNFQSLCSFTIEKDRLQKYLQKSNFIKSKDVKKIFKDTPNNLFNKITLVRQRMKKLERSISQCARTIANLPVKEWVKWK